MFCLICAWKNGSAYNQDAGDLRRHRAHYDVTVMRQAITWSNVNRDLWRLMVIMSWTNHSFTHDGEVITNISITLQWLHNDCHGVSNHPHMDCLLNRLFSHISKKASKLRVTGLCEGNRRWPVDSPHEGPVMQKIFPFDDIIMKFDGSMIMLFISKNAHQRWNCNSKHKYTNTRISREPFVY